MVERIRLPFPHSGMQAVLEQAKRFNWLCAGRRWRKTTLKTIIAVEGAIEGREVIWGAPVYKQVLPGWEECVKATRGVATPHQGHMTLTIPRAGRIRFVSLNDPDTSRGWTADRVIIDEAGDAHRDAWSSVLRPMLTSTGGDAWIGGTPRGLNWFWDGWENASDLADAMRWQAPTLGMRIEDGVLIREPHPLENPEMAFEEMESIFYGGGLTEAKFREEFLAEWSDSGDSVFKVADIAALQTGWSGLVKRESGHKYLTAWDIGRRKDATVGITIDYTSNPWHVVAYERFEGMPYPGIQDKIEERARAYGGRTLVESNGPGDPVIENLSVVVEPFVTTARAKVDSITALQLVLERAALKVSIPQITRELKAYLWADKDLVQDCVMTLGIAAHELPRPSRPGARGPYTAPRRDRATTFIGKRQVF